jgi:hypothetical protein
VGRGDGGKGRQTDRDRMREKHNQTHSLESTVPSL